MKRFRVSPSYQWNHHYFVEEVIEPHEVPLKAKTISVTGHDDEPICFGCLRHAECFAAALNLGHEALQREEPT